MKKILSILFLVSVGLQAGKGHMSRKAPMQNVGSYNTDKTDWGSHSKDDQEDYEMPLLRQQPRRIMSDKEKKEHVKLLIGLAEEAEKHRQEMIKDELRYKRAIAEYNAAFDKRMADELAAEKLGEHSTNDSEVHASRRPVMKIEERFVQQDRASVKK
jgi:hypothetical protein